MCAVRHGILTFLEKKSAMKMEAVGLCISGTLVSTRRFKQDG
jgi:hypothetical protein